MQDVFLWILGNFEEHPFWKASANDCFYISNTTIQQTTLQNQSPNIAKQQQQEEEIQWEWKF